jgi:hypothetical protein
MRARPSVPTRSSEDWLLPPTWPLDDARTMVIAAARGLTETRLALLTRAWTLASRDWVDVHRQRLALGFAISAAMIVAAVSLRIGLSRRDVVPLPIAAAPISVTMAPPTLALATFEPSVAVALETTATPPATTETAVPQDSDRRLLSDASTMDLMMPIAEPDLDITSRDSLWSQIGKSMGVDPLLLYSVALVESKALYPDGKVAPTPWLFRVNDHLVRGDRHDVQLAMAAASQFGSGVQDVGIMQVYYPMHRDAVRDPLTLLNPRTNITVAATILREGMHQTHDRVLGVGYYHSHTPSLARDYGTAVLTVYQRLQSMHRASAKAVLHRGPAARI